MKKNNKIKLSMIALAAAMLSATACTPAAANVQLPNAAVAVENQEIAESQVHENLAIDANADLSEAEVAGLLFMREEEKLAGDVYRYLYNLWGSAVFQNIAESEDMHTESVLALMNAYGIADATPAQAGQYSNADLQALYAQLTAQGSQSLQDAFLVGAAIEEIDILDLESRMAQTGNADILLVYENLVSGSENHLRAFVRVIENQMRQAYSPQYMTQAQYDAIMAGANGAGSGIGGQGFGQGNGAGKP